MAKYQNKYRVESARAAWWDYGSPGAYFIRNDPEYQRINDYIESNPENWDKDRFHK